MREVQHEVFTLAMFTFRIVAPSYFLLPIDASMFHRASLLPSLRADRGGDAFVAARIMTLAMVLADTRKTGDVGSSPLPLLGAGGVAEIADEWQQSVRRIVQSELVWPRSRRLQV